MRQSGIEALADVKSALMEPDGRISIIALSKDDTDGAGHGGGAKTQRVV